MRAKKLKRCISSQVTKKSKRVANTLELILSRTVQTWIEIKSIQDYDEQEIIKEA
jgi:trehalose-6-phosphate synthase